MSNLSSPFFHYAAVQVLAALGLLHVPHLEERALSLYSTVVGHLAAHLGIERRPVEHYGALCALAQLAGELALDDQRLHLRPVRELLVACEHRRHGVEAQVEPGPAADIAPRGPCPLALLLHEGVEALGIGAHARLAQHVLREVERETVGVVELEGVRAREHGPALGFELVHELAEDAHAAVYRAGEALLLGAYNLRDEALLVHKVGVGRAVLVYDGLADLIEEGLVHAEELAVPRGPSEQPSEDIAAALVRGQHAVAYHKGRRPDVVGDDAQGNVVPVALAVVRAGELRDLVGDVHNGIDIEEAVHALADAGEALEAHAGVDILLRELGVVALAVGVELGKDVVPDLDVPVAVAADGAVGLAAAVFLAAVVIYLRAGAAGAGAVLPEVVGLAEAEDTLGRYAYLVAPDVEGLVVVLVDGRVQPVGVDADPVRAREELPAPGDGLVLEVVAEGEVAEHLEVGAVARGLAYILDITGADALLAGADAAAGRGLLAGEVGLHRRHARVYEQQRGVVLRYERKARQPQVPLRFKKREKHLPEFIKSKSLHNNLPGQISVFNHNKHPNKNCQARSEKLSLAGSKREYRSADKAADSPIRTGSCKAKRRPFERRLYLPYSQSRMCWPVYRR